MQTADLRDRPNWPELGRLDRASFWRLIVKPRVGPRPMVVFQVLADDPLQVSLAEHDELVQALAATSLKHPKRRA